MPDLIREYLDLASTSLDDFVVKPDSSDADLARQYVVTTAIRPRIAKILSAMEDHVSRHIDFGRFIYGSFGSGKSHLLRILGMMLADDGVLYANAVDSQLRTLRAGQPWLDRTKLLVVHANLMGTTTSFTRKIAERFNQRLIELGHPPVDIFGVERVFAQVDAWAARSPSFYADFEAEFGVDHAEFKRRRALLPTDERRVELARTAGEFIAGSPDAFQPDDGEARERMAAHAKRCGYDAVVFTIDEFVLWAQSLEGQQYAAAVNALNGLVESNDRRDARFIVIVAIQRSIKDVFPDDRSEEALREQLDRLDARFPTERLEDSNLFEITERRVLRPRDERRDAWESAVAGALARIAREQRSTLVGDEAPEKLAMLYPFHPALLRVLCDVTQGLQRERTSLYILYQLLTRIRPDLEVGQLLSLGALWDALFEPEQIAGIRDYGQQRSPTHHANQLVKTFDTYLRLRESIRRAAATPDDERVLDLIVKAILLCQRSTVPFFETGQSLATSVTVETIFRLNRFEIRATGESFGVRKVFELLSKLAEIEPGTLVLRGQHATATVAIEYDAVDIQGLLDGLRPDGGQRTATLLNGVRELLGLRNVGMTGAEAKLPVTWQATTWNGRAVFETMDAFSPGTFSSGARGRDDCFGLAILLEGSDPGQSVADALANAIARIERARDDQQAWVAGWIPAPLSSDGRDALERLAKVALFDRDVEANLRTFRQSDWPAVKNRIAAVRQQATTSLEAALRIAYGEGSTVLTMRKDPSEIFPPGSVDLAARPEFIAGELVKRRFAQYPPFKLTPRALALNYLLRTYSRLLTTSQQNAVDGDEGERVTKLGVPLELFDGGHGVASVRATPGTYYEALKAKLASVAETRVGKLEDELAREPYGLGRDVVRFLIAVLALREDYRLHVDGHAIPIAQVSDIVSSGTLAKGILPSLAKWNAARTAAVTIFGVSDVPAANALTSVDALMERLPKKLEGAIATLDAVRSAFARVARARVPGANGAVEARYTGTWRELVALRDQHHIIDRLAELGPRATEIVASIDAAARDADALAALAADPYLALVLKEQHLADWLQKILGDDQPPLQSKLLTWKTKATEYIRSLAEASQRHEDTETDGDLGDGNPLINDSPSRAESAPSNGDLLTSLHIEVARSATIEQIIDEMHDRFAVAVTELHRTDGTIRIAIRFIDDDR